MEAATETTSRGFEALGRAWRGLAPLAAGLALAAPAACSPTSPPSAAWGIITIGGATYRLPAEAFTTAEPSQGLQSSMLLELPVIAHADRSPGDPLQVLLLAIDGRDAQDRLRQIQGSIALNASISAMPRLKRRGQPLRPSTEPVAGAPAGLVRVAVDPPEATDAVVSDVFVRPPLAATTEYISCARPSTVARFPLCEQEFAAKGMTVKATYPREELPRWNEIRRAVLTYLSAHRASS